MAVGDALLDAAFNDEDKAQRMIIEWSFAPASHIGNMNAAPGMWLPGNNLALMRRMSQGVLHNDLTACRAYVNGLDAAKKVHVPTFVLSAGKEIIRRQVTICFPNRRVMHLGRCGALQTKTVDALS
jgi:hypothetical protein